VATHVTPATSERLGLRKRVRSWLRRQARPEGTEQPPSLWPYGVATALVAVPVLWLLIALVLWVAHHMLEWPTQSTAGGVVYIATLVGLTPIWLVVLDWMAARRGAVTTTWFSIDFSKGVASDTGPSVQLETSLGRPGVPINETSVASIHTTLNDAKRSDVVRLDLETGDAWWLTRLFALAAGAVRSAAPKILVFVGVEPRSGRRGAFLGWIRPDDAFRLILVERQPLREVYDRSQAIAQALRTAEATSLPLVQPVAAPPGSEAAVAAAYAPRMQGLGEEVYLRVLLDQLGVFESAQNPVGGERVTARLLDALFADAIHRDAVDLTWDSRGQLKAFLADSGDYVAITRNSRFRRIVERDALENALLRQLVLPEESATGEPSSPTR
jgi:hypothetical protein